MGAGGRRIGGPRCRVCGRPRRKGYESPTDRPPKRLAGGGGQRSAGTVRRRSPLPWTRPCRCGIGRRGGRSDGRHRSGRPRLQRRFHPHGLLRRTRCGRGRAGRSGQRAGTGIVGAHLPAVHARTWSRRIDVVAAVAGAMPTPSYRRSIPRDMPGMLEPDVVARRTLDVLGKGPRVVTGLLNRLSAQLIGRLLTRRAAIRLIAANTKDLE